MKKFLIIVLFILTIFSLSAEERVWYMQSTRMTDNINLGDTYYLPDYTKTWTQDKSLGDASKGTYSTINTLGNFGVMSCDHKLCFTVTTNGRFVSQSDPSKYREYYLAMRPKCRIYNGNDTNYNLGSDGADVEKSDRLINTKLTGQMSYITPPVSETGSYVKIDKNGTMKTIDRFHADLLILMDSMDSQDLQHLSEDDDYVTSLTIEWHCEDLECTDPQHSGAYTMVLRGYYGDNDPTFSLVSLFVKPTVAASNLDIMKVLEEKSGKEIISDISFYCSSKAKYNWNNKIYVFLSANSDAKTSDASGFKLLNKTTGQIIPYKLNVYDGLGSLVGTFDGKDRFNNSKPAHYVDFNSSTLIMNDREGNKSYSIIFDGNVEIDFNESGISPQIINSNLDAYNGMYTSTVYYYVITSENSYI